MKLFNASGFFSRTSPLGPKCRPLDASYKAAAAKFSSVAAKKAVCMLGGDSMAETILRMYDNNPAEMEKRDVTFINSPGWLESIHSDWYEQSWGQGKNYLLKYSGLIAKTLYPNYPEDKPLKFKMMQEIHRGKLDLIKEKKIKIIEAHADYLVEDDCGLSLLVGDEKKIIVPHNDFSIIHAGREPVGIKECAVQHFGKIYSNGKKDLKGVPLVVIGSGLNLVWAIRDFKDRPIIHIIPEGDRTLPHLYDSLHASLPLVNCVIEHEDDDTLSICGMDLKSGKNIVRYVPVNEVYSASGFELNKDRVQVSEDKVIYVDVAPRAKDIVNFSALNGEKFLQTKDMRGTLVPDGNLTLNTLKIMHSLPGKYPLEDAKSVMYIEGWRKAVLENAEISGITVEPMFFDNLKEVIKHSFTDFIPSEEQIWQVIKVVYNRGASVTTNLGVIPSAHDTNGTPVVWDDFKGMILHSNKVVQAAEISEEESMNLTPS